jgi:hypothetical protein
MLVRTTLRTCAVNSSRPKAFLLLLFLMILPGSLQAESPVARQSLSDLRSVDLNDATPLRLEDEWALRPKELGYARGFLIRGQTNTPQEIADLIFDNGLPTNHQLTEISGRGIGMEAVRQYLDRAGGRVHVFLNGQPNGGFCAFAFHIHVPKNLHTLAA